MSWKRLFWAQVEGAVFGALCALAYLFVVPSVELSGQQLFLFFAIIYTGGVVHHLWWDRWTDRAFEWLVNTLRNTTKP